VLVVLVVGGWLVVQGAAQRRFAETATAQVSFVATSAAESMVNDEHRAQAERMATDAANEAATAQAKRTATAQARAAEMATVVAHETATAETNETATSVALTRAAATATAVAHETATTEANETATVEALVAETAAAAANRTATVAANRTATAVAEAEATAQALQTAMVQRSVSVLSVPVYAAEAQIAFLNPGQSVTVLGRAPERYGEYFYVRTGDDVEGYAYGPYFAWPGNMEDLEVIEPKTAVPTSLPRSALNVSAGTLRIVQVWPASLCIEGGWNAFFEVKIAGGNGRSYVLYWEDERVSHEVKDAERDVAVIQRPGVGGVLVGTITVRSGDQTASQAVSAQKPNCN
jgi:hypothetical protein